MQIQHMAFAVNDARAALARYRTLLPALERESVTDFAGSRTRVARFWIGGVEYQLCQSLDAGGRFDSWIRARGSEGLHHICYRVAEIDSALEDALAQGARLRECSACRKTGAHPHPEGFVAFLDDDLSGVEVEFMQLYTEAERAEFAGGADV